MVVDKKSDEVVRNETVTARVLYVMSSPLESLPYLANFSCKGADGER